MSAIKKLVLANLEATKARLSEGRQWIGIKNLETPDEVQPRAGIEFMNPEQLIASLGPMIPEELKAEANGASTQAD